MVGPNLDLSLMFSLNANPEDVTYEETPPRVEDQDTGKLLPAGLATSISLKAIRGGSGRGNGPTDTYTDQANGRSKQRGTVFWFAEIDMASTVPKQGALIIGADGDRFRIHRVEFDRFSQIYECDVRRVGT